MIKQSMKGISHEEWLKLRKEGIGGSDAGAICGLNPYSSPMSVYQDKTSQEQTGQDNEAMRQGRDLEDYVARRFTEATGLKVRRSNAMYKSQEHPFMLADVDRLVVGEDAGLECKTANVFQADKWKDGAVPDHYLIQCLHYLAVTGKKSWYLAVVILGREFRYVKIEREEGMIRDLIAIEEDFWMNHVVPRVMPDPDGSRICDEVLSRYFPRAKGGTLLLPDSFNRDLERRQEILRLMERLEQEQRQIEQKIKLFLGESQEAQNPKYRVSWSNVETLRIDSRRFKEEQPDLYSRFAKPSHSRRFTVKAA